ncbi:hypothetical protein EJ04DRAFT_487494 [Polyplosphaeria fusca]|uniref:LCCL domain-containing protein n=1 Tax=Polyplosphaeria fusca TaxID=682080 RepID=A0A9P4R4B8_9PLEO|nr:hypothetical protein EJ04DRAFT_487494 [Polyplosphaeria fusca]
MTRAHDSEPETSGGEDRSRRNSAQVSNVSVKSSTWVKIQRRIPTSIASLSRRVGDWIKGPQPPRKHRIKPLFEPVQMFLPRMFARLPKAGQVLVLLCAFAVWVAVFVTILSNGSLPGDIGGFGPPVRLACITRLWPDSPSCGLDGRNCLPFDDQSFAFSCPADCSSAHVLNPRAIGNESIIYRSLVVGGTPDASQGEDIYRGDSFICGAAIHAGVISNSRGGCGVVSLAGEKSSYGSVTRNGIQSVAFDSTFPLSFNFNQDQRVLSSAAKCGDPRWKALGLSVVFTVFFSVITTSPAVFFFPVFIITYFQIALASDPPPFDTYPSAVSTALATLLPALFIMTLLFHTTLRQTLTHLTAPLEKAILWTGALWVSSLNSLTLGKIPLQRLTAHDISQQPGALASLIIIILVLLVIAFLQVSHFRTERRLPRYLALYALLASALLISLSFPRLNLRIHHYILALLLLPGTALQTRPSLLYQGLLVGLFINGVARWGFASVLQTSAALRGDAQLGRGVPSILPPAINGSNITFEWEPLVRGWDGVSVLVNDVERFRGLDGGETEFTWVREAMDTPEYFRFGFVNYVAFGGVMYSDFTRAGVWGVDGEWSGIPDGVT